MQVFNFFILIMFISFFLCFSKFYKSPMYEIIASWIYLRHVLTYSFIHIIAVSKFVERLYDKATRTDNARLRAHLMCIVYRLIILNWKCLSHNTSEEDPAKPEIDGRKVFFYKSYPAWVTSKILSQAWAVRL